MVKLLVLTHKLTLFYILLSPHQSSLNLLFLREGPSGMILTFRTPLFELENEACARSEFLVMRD